MLSDVLEIEHEEDQLEARRQAFQTESQASVDRIQAKRDALAARMAAESIPAAMKQHGDTTVILSIDGKLHAVPVTYLSQPAPEPAPAAAPDATPASA